MTEYEEVPEELATSIFRDLRRSRTHRTDFIDGRCGQVCDVVCDPKT